MRKTFLKSLIIIPITFLFLSFINASAVYNNETCDITPDGKVNIKPAKKETLGVLPATTCEYITGFSTKIEINNYRTEEEAKKACDKKIQELLPSCCKTDDAKTTCKGKAVCNKDNYDCTPKKCRSRNITITYNNNGGTGCSSKTVLRDRGEIGELCTPTREGYDFVGWYKEKEFKTPITSNTKTDSINESITVYAKWSKKEADKINCAGGNYLPKNTATCRICPSGSRCPGGNYIKNHGSDQGIYKCSKNCWSQKGSVRCDCNRPGIDLPSGESSLLNNNIKNNYFSVNSNVLSNNAVVYTGDEGVTCDGWYIEYKVPGSTNIGNCKDSENDVSILSYVIETKYPISSGDAVYCLQPGKTGPSMDGMEYIEDRKFDIMNCKNQFETKNGDKRVECGLAQIMYQTVKYDESKKSYVSNGNYTNAEITMALRLWMAVYAGNSQIGLGDVTKESNDFTIDWIPKENYYEKIAKAIMNISKEDAIKFVSTYNKNNKNIIMCSKGETTCGIVKAVELFKDAQYAKDFSFIENPKTDLEEGIVVEEKYVGEPYVKEYKIGLPKVLQTEKIEQNCKDITSPACDVEIKVYLDITGKEIPGSKVEGYCKKEYCEVKIVFPEKIVCDKTLSEQDMGKTTLQVKLKGLKDTWYENSGWLRFYVAKSNPEKYQKMIGFMFNKNYCEKKYNEENPEKTDETFTIPLSRIECPCNENEKCNDLNKTKQLPINCSSDKTTTVNTDPDMSCIINACYSHDKLKYNKTIELGANPSVCNIYCREESEFYLADKTTVYAGMQFSYDIAPKLIENKIINGVLDAPFKPNPKLTSIVIQKKQCTSEIKYDEWKKEFDRLNTYIKNTSNNTLLSEAKKDLNQWIYDLQNCNLYSSKDIKAISNTYNSATSKGTSKEAMLDKATCSDSNCLNLEFSYDDPKYGEKTTLGKLSTSTNVDTKYCKNSGNKVCYQYKKDTAVQINDANKLETLNYCDGSKCNNSIKLPTNDYASVIATFQNEFYQPKKYQVEAYSGIVSLISETIKGKSYTPLADYSYPISINTKTGTYNVYYKFSNISSTLKDYNYTCTYDVLNTTTSYDCKIVNKDGSIDLSKCRDKCYKIKDGIPIIDENCVTWESNDKKGYGFIYRNVNLNELFPNAVIDENGISTRDSSNNWTNKQEVIEEIQNNANSIFTNEEEHLEYRYTLTPEAIKNIKRYNKDQNKIGGYLNDTLSGCELIKDKTGLQSFANCKSSFLDDVRNGKFSSIKVSGNKAGGF